MKIGFHHHVPSVFTSEDRVRVPAFFGTFIDELARQAGSVVYYTFEGESTGMEDHELVAPRVRCVNLGPRPKAPIAMVRWRHVLQGVDFAADELDGFVVRGPGPLVPGLIEATSRASIPTAALIMGDYRSWAPNDANAAWRNALIYLYTRIYLYRQDRALHRAMVLANNPWLLQRTSGKPYADGHLVFTSSLTDEMFEAAGSNTTRAPDGAVRLLYTGRIVEEKGVLLMVEAVRLLRDRGIAAKLELVGWAPPGDPTADAAVATADQLGISEHVKLSGYLTASTELMDRYAQADVFVFAAPTEWGAPHTVIEAMAARLPVVASAIEGLRDLLRDGDEAVLVEPGSATALADGVERVVRDPELAERLRASGRRWAGEHTNERSAALVMGHLRDRIEAS